MKWFVENCGFFYLHYPVWGANSAVTSTVFSWSSAEGSSPAVGSGMVTITTSLISSSDEAMEDRQNYSTQDETAESGKMNVDIWYFQRPSQRQQKQAGIKWFEMVGAIFETEE